MQIVAVPGIGGLLGVEGALEDSSTLPHLLLTPPASHLGGGAFLVATAGLVAAGCAKAHRNHLSSWLQKYFGERGAGIIHTPSTDATMMWSAKKRKHNTAQ